MNQQSFFTQFRKISPDSAIASCFLCILILLVSIQTSDQFAHWFLIPVTFSGILIGIDLVDWFRGRLNLFDPVGIIGLLGFHFFFLAPLLHVSLDFWYGGDLDIIPPSDWRPWIGNMAILNFVGLCVYRLSRNFVLIPVANSVKQTIWTFNRKRFIPILCGALVLSAVLQAIVYQKFGGIGSFIDAARDSRLQGIDDDFKGMGIVFMFSESFPILAMIGFAAYAKQHKGMQRWTVLIGVLLIFLALRMLFGGLRGSRSLTIWALFWAIGIIHFWIRRISKKQIAIGLVFLVFFMYFYGFFKTGGIEGVNTALEGGTAKTDLTEKTGRSWEGLVLQDLGRSDVQAFLLYRLTQPDKNYEYALGRTYVAAATMLIPSAIFPDKPPDKVKDGTEAQYGIGTYHPQLWASSKVYGLAGEAMLNFGPLVVPLFFVFLGVVVGQTRECLLRWRSLDTRFLLLPFLVNLCFVVLVGDFDNVIFFVVKNGGLPCCVVWLSSRKAIR